jgi:DNA-binding PadR family transcriptional regulator
MFRHLHRFESRSRLFEKGDLKYVILDLIKDKPAHGYEIMRALEEICHGFYSPSAGSVYPTLQLLEDMGYVKSSEQDGKKTYTITEEGRNFLKTREDTVDKIKDHMRDWWGFENHEEFRDIFNELRATGRSIARKARNLDRDKLNRIKEVLARACREIDIILDEKQGENQDRKTV